MDYWSLASGALIGLAISAIIVSARGTDDMAASAARRRQLEHRIKVMRDALALIHGNETNGANATVRRMAHLARAALVVDELQAKRDRDKPVAKPHMVRRAPVD